MDKENRTKKAQQNQPLSPIPKNTWHQPIDSHILCFDNVLFFHLSFYLNLLKVFPLQPLEKSFFLIKFHSQIKIDKLPRQKHYGLPDQTL